MRTDTPSEEVARLWFEVTEQQWDNDLFAYFAEQAQASPVMATAPIEVIALAGRIAFLGNNSLPMNRWEAQVLDLQEATRSYASSPSATEHGLDFMSWWTRREPIAALDRLITETQLMDQLGRSFPTRTVRDARDLLVNRILSGNLDTRSGVLRPLRYRPHLRYPDYGALPVIKVPTVEVVLLHLLALTYPALQFFYDKHGQPVPGFANGYHGADRPAAISGMSIVLDAVGEIVEEHRYGSGGRIYVSDARVTCPRHRHNIAIIDAG